MVAGEAMGKQAVIETRTPIMYLHYKIEPGGMSGADCAVSGAGAAGATGAASTDGSAGAGSTAGCPMLAVEWPVFNFEPEPMAAGLGVADGAASPEAASPAAGEKLTAADATAGVRESSMRGP